MKNKNKNILLILILTFVFSTIFIVSTSKKENEYVKIVFSEEEIVEDVTNIYLLDDNEEICSVSYPDKLTIDQILLLYTQKINYFPNAHSPLLLPTQCTYETRKETITIKLDKCSNKVNVDKLLTCFEKTFKEFNFNTIDLLIGKAFYNKKIK